MFLNKKSTVLVLNSRKSICHLSSSFEEVSFLYKSDLLQRSKHETGDHLPLATLFHYQNKTENLGNVP